LISSERSTPAICGALHPDAKTARIAGLDHPNAKARWWCLQLMDHLADESYLQPILSKLSDPVA